MDIIKRPLITEKSITDAKSGKFTFIIAKTADKDAVKRVVEERFSVHVLDVATSIVKGRKKRVGIRRNEVAISDYKKATVTLKAGEKIALFDINAE